MEAERDEEAGLLNNEALATSSPEKAPPSNQEQGAVDEVTKKSSPRRGRKSAVTGIAAVKAPSKATVPQNTGTQASVGKLARPSKNALSTQKIPLSKRKRSEDYSVDDIPSPRGTPVRINKRPKARSEPHVDPGNASVPKHDKSSKRDSNRRATGQSTSNTKKKRTGTSSGSRPEVSRANVSQDAAERRTQSPAGDSEEGSERDSRPRVRAPKIARAKAAKERWMTLGRLQLWEDIRTEVEEVQSGTLTTETKIAKRLNQALAETTNLYKNIGSLSDDCHTRADLETQLPALTQHVQNVLSKLQRVKPSECPPKLVRDMYIVCIPTFVRLLGQAMECRVKGVSSEAPYDLVHLEEIFDIQTILLSLLHLATGWQKDPEATRPVIRSIKQRIMPYLERLHRHFRQALVDERVQNRVRSNYERYGKDYQEMETSEDELSGHEDQVDVLEAMMDDIDRERASFLQRPMTHLPFRTKNASPRRSKTRGRDQSGWTQEEDFSLCNELLNNLDSRLLPPQQRYIEILNTPLLQEKYIGQIRERALYMKPGLIEATSDGRGRVPDFVLSIE